MSSLSVCHFLNLPKLLKVFILFPEVEWGHATVEPKGSKSSSERKKIEGTFVLQNALNSSLFLGMSCGFRALCLGRSCVLSWHPEPSAWHPS